MAVASNESYDQICSERMEAAFLSLRKSWYKMYDSLHKNHLPNEHQCLLIGYKYMNLLLRHLCARHLEGKNQSERQTGDKDHPKQHEALVIMSSQRFSAYKLCSPVLVPMRVPAGTVRVEQDRQQDKKTDFKNMQY
jgi:hypothetical protein